MNPMSGCDIRLVFTLPPRDSTLQYKYCVQLRIITSTVPLNPFMFTFGTGNPLARHFKVMEDPFITCSSPGAFNSSIVGGTE